ncbi:hypothetical protein F0U61_13890 [Archangium violaceum]|uniref:hypothetical protein n=1 Tax=Archangium violaceum TaxID=83451 RepID=UPI002B2DA4CA|nr:hypothetical protein F0U61_13890 [Archangium violaceum]
MVLTPPPPSRALAAICYVAALGAGGLGVFLVAQVLPGDGSQQKRLFFMGLAGLSLSFALLMVAVAELGRRGVLLWRNEGGKLIGQVMATGEQVFMPARGPARVDVELRALSNGVNAEQYSVWLFSPLFGPVRMGAGGGGNVEIVRQRWGAATFSEADAELPPRPPPDSGVEVEPDGRCRVPAGWGLFAMLFLMSGLLVVLPMVAVALMSSGPGGQLFAAGTCVVAAAVALFTLLYAFSHWELRVEADGVQIRRCVGPLSLGSWRRLPGDLRLDLSRAPRISWVDSSGKAWFRVLALVRRPTLTGVLWLTAALRRTSGARPQSWRAIP